LRETALRELASFDGAGQPAFGGTHSPSLTAINRHQAESGCEHLIVLVALDDAVGLECNRFLTNDKQLRNKSDQVQERWQLVIRRPSEFLVEAVQAGAPRTTRAPWPWESIDRIQGGCPTIGGTHER
jgi:hypothetical protein